MFFHLFILGLCSTIFALSSSPGAQIRITEAALNSAANSLVAELNALGSNLHLPDESTKWHKIHVDLKDIVINEFHIDATQKKIITNSDNSFTLQCSSISVAVSFHYRVHWHKISKSGNCKTSIDGSSASMKFSVSQSNSHPILNLIDRSVNVRNLKYHCHGGFIDHLINALKHWISGKLEKELKNFAEKEISDYIPKISNKLQALPLEHQLKGKLDGIFVNYGLSSNPTSKNQQLRIPLISQFWYKGHKDDQPATVYPSPHPFPDSAPPQMFCVNLDTNLVFRSFIYAFNVSDKSSFTIDAGFFKRLPEGKKQFFDCDCLGSNCLVDLVPEMKKTCAKGKTFGIHGSAKIGGDAYANASGLYAYGDGVFNFKLDNDIALLTINANLGMLLEKTVTIKNWSLYGKVDVVSASLSANSTLGPIAPEILNKIWNIAMKDVVEVVANDVLADGIPLPPLSFITFKNINLHFDTSSIQVCSDVDFDFKRLLS